MSVIVHVPLTRDRVALIDEIDWPLVRAHRWHAHQSRGTFYARTRIDGKPVYMHRLLTNAPKGLVVGHRDDDGLNDRRCNLVVFTHGPNRHMTGEPLSVTGFRGVVYHQQRYSARVTHDGIRHWLGRYDTPEEAARAYDAKAIELYGPFAFTNFPRPVDVVAAPAEDIPF